MSRTTLVIAAATGATGLGFAALGDLVSACVAVTIGAYTCAALLRSEIGSGSRHARYLRKGVAGAIGSGVLITGAAVLAGTLDYLAAPAVAAVALLAALWVAVTAALAHRDYATQDARTGAARQAAGPSPDDTVSRVREMRRSLRITAIGLIVFATLALFVDAPRWTLAAALLSGASLLAAMIGLRRMESTPHRGDGPAD